MLRINQGIIILNPEILVVRFRTGIEFSRRVRAVVRVAMRRRVREVYNQVIQMCESLIDWKMHNLKRAEMALFFQIFIDILLRLRLTITMLSTR